MADNTPPDSQSPHVPTQRVEATAIEPAAISRARHVVAEQLRRWRCADPDDATLVLSELVTNAVVHAGGAVRITVTRHGEHVRIDVHDNDSARPHLRAYGTNPGGLGLHIVDQLSERWGSQRTVTGKLVWAVVSCANERPR